MGKELRHIFIPSDNRNIIRAENSSQVVAAAISRGVPIVALCSKRIYPKNTNYAGNCDECIGVALAIVEAAMKEDSPDA